jgi:hypothetical protein
MWVYGPESCLVKYSDENFTCTYGGRGCPSMVLDTDAGEYVVVVGSGSCSVSPGTDAPYRLDFNASWDPKIVQIQDDVQNYGSVEYDIDGAAVLSK